MNFTSNFGAKFKFEITGGRHEKNSEFSGTNVISILNL